MCLSVYINLWFWKRNCSEYYINTKISGFTSRSLSSIREVMWQEYPWHKQMLFPFRVSYPMGAKYSGKTSVSLTLEAHQKFKMTGKQALIVCMQCIPIFKILIETTCYCRLSESNPNARLSWGWYWRQRHTNNS